MGGCGSLYVLRTDGMKRKNKKAKNDQRMREWELVVGLCISLEKEILLKEEQLRKPRKLIPDAEVREVKRKEINEAIRQSGVEKLIEAEDKRDLYRKVVNEQATEWESLINRCQQMIISIRTYFIIEDLWYNDRDEFYKSIRLLKQMLRKRKVCKWGWAGHWPSLKS